MKAQLKSKRYFFISLGLLLIFGLLFSLIFTKAISFQYFNQYHNHWLDSFFIPYTYAGDGLLSVLAVVIFLLFKKYKAALCLLIAFLSSGIIAQILKAIFSLPRPKLFFEQGHIPYKNFIEGITLNSNNSFPSGHTTSAFAMATILVLLSEKKRTQVIALTLAILVGYSRMYLGQHFLQDVVTGGCIGVTCAIASYCLVYKKSFKTPKFDDLIDPE